jgi:hypothetical protein
LLAWSVVLTVAFMAYLEIIFFVVFQKGVHVSMCFLLFLVLQKALKEKQEHIEQLLKERDMERSEFARTASQIDEVSLITVFGTDSYGTDVVAVTCCVIHS